MEYVFPSENVRVPPGENVRGRGDRAGQHNTWSDTRDAWTQANVFKMKICHFTVLNAQVYGTSPTSFSHQTLNTNNQ